MTVRSRLKDTLFVPGKKLIAQREIREYFRRTTEPKLNLGAGGNRVPGWLNVDLSPSPGVTFMDGAFAWPFAAGSFDAILCEHMIEHVPKSLGQHLLREMCRTLKPGGWARVITPDLDWFASRILQPASAADDSYRQFINGFMKRETTSWCDAINLCFYEHGHRYIWSIEELKSELRLAGFAELTVTRAALPVQAVFRGAEGHPRLVGAENDALEAFAIEAMPAATKPSTAVTGGAGGARGEQKGRDPVPAPEARI